MLTRILQQRRLRADSIDAYREYHNNVWPELEALYRAYGVTAISCFIHGLDLCVYMEYDPAIFEAKLDELKAHPVESKWQALMADFNDPDADIREYEEVYRLPAGDAVSE